ncbi:hypothetical protein [Flexivirga caeni]|uniref:hypothetical protein n=1 Tax=Flexivirga caeni TaxID=2294115 RepID=UPI0013159148|nr:hypothetical protein [Flexivirga caeni]
MTTSNLEPCTNSPGCGTTMHAQPSLVTASPSSRSISNTGGFADVANELCGQLGTLVR